MERNDVMDDAEVIKKMISGIMFYAFKYDVFQYIHMDADSYIDVEEGSLECERIEDLFWEVFTSIDEIITIEQIEQYIKGLPNE
jgi:hypothetical protein